MCVPDPLVGAHSKHGFLAIHAFIIQPATLFWNWYPSWLGRLSRRYRGIPTLKFSWYPEAAAVLDYVLNVRDANATSRELGHSKHIRFRAICWRTAQKSKRIHINLGTVDGEVVR